MIVDLITSILYWPQVLFRSRALLLPWARCQAQAFFRSLSGAWPGLRLSSLRVLLSGLLLGVLVSNGFAQTARKVLYVNSYHAGYAWSDGIVQGIQSRFMVEDIRFKIHYMDSKRNRSPAAMRAAAIQAKYLIDRLKPDVVIISGDVAAKYLLAPYFKDVALPVVYVGINWDTSIYGLPYQNTTGMVEVNLIEPLIDLLSGYAEGKRLGYLSIDALSGRRNLEFYERNLNRKMDRVYFANTVDEWERDFLSLQQQVDMMVLENPEGIQGWTASRARRFVENNARIPVGSAYQWLAPYSLITIAKIPEEQGWWAAEQSIKILNGTRPSDIPETRNKQGKLIVNLSMANLLGITLSSELLQTATIVK